MPRRLLALLALSSALAVVACQGAPGRPTISDPKEILAQTVLALKDIQTVQVKGELSGTVKAEGLGSGFDLAGTTIDVAADFPGKKAKVNISAPALMGTSAEIIAVDQTGYFKVTGPFAQFIGADPSGKYMKQAIDATGDTPADVATDPQKAIDEFRTALDKLPAPTKAADERCGDKDCYHVVLTLTEKDVAALDPDVSATTPFTLTVDIWSQKDDLRPAKLVVKVDGGDQGTATMTFTLTYGGSVNVAAPPADQVANP